MNKDYCKSLQWDSKNLIYQDIQCTVKTNNIYCDLCRDRYIKSYVNYKSLTYDINTYPIAKIGEKFDIKTIDTEEFYRSTLQLLVPKLTEVIELRKEHTRVFYSFYNEEETETHNKIIKRFVILLKLLMPYYKKWKEYFISLKEESKPLTIQTLTPFPYTISSIDEIQEQKRKKEFENTERNKLREQWKKEYTEELQKREQEIRKERESIIKKQQEVPNEYINKNKVDLLDPSLIIIGRSIIFNEIVYNFCINNVLSKDYYIPINQQFKDCIYEFIKLVIDIRVKDEKQELKIYRHWDYDSFINISMSTIYNKHVRICDTKKIKSAFLNSKYRAKIESIINIIREPLINIINLTDKLDLTPLEKELQLIRESNKQVPNKYTSIHYIISDVIVNMLQKSPYMYLLFNKKIIDKDDMDIYNNLLNERDKEDKLYEEQNKCLVKFNSVLGDLGNLKVKFSDNKSTPTFYEYKFSEQLNEYITNKLIPQLKLIKTRMNISNKELESISFRAFAYFISQMTIPINIERILTDYKRDSKELWQAFCDALLFEGKFIDMYKMCNTDCTNKVIIFMNLITYLLNKQLV